MRGQRCSLVRGKRWKGAVRCRSVLLEENIKQGGREKIEEIIK